MDISKVDSTSCLTSHEQQASNATNEVEPKRVNGKRYDGQCKTDDQK